MSGRKANTGPFETWNASDLYLKRDTTLNNNSPQFWLSNWNCFDLQEEVLKHQEKGYRFVGWAFPRTDLSLNPLANSDYVSWIEWIAQTFLKKLLPQSSRTEASEISVNLKYN